MRHFVKVLFGIFPVIVPLCLTPSAISARSLGGFEMKSPEGFHWYSLQERRSEEEEMREENASPSISDSKAQKTPRVYTQRMKKFQEDMQEAQTRAVMNPTYENVKIFKAYQDQAMNQSTDFSKMWLAVNLMEGGQRLEDNSDLGFRKIYEAEESKKIDQALQETAKTHGLFFFFKQDCPYCHKFAPVLSRFAKKYGFEVKAISKAGGSIKEFPNSVRDNGMGDTLNPDGLYPSVFMANPQTGEVIPLAQGFSSLAGLKENFKHIVSVLGDLS